MPGGPNGVALRLIATVSDSDPSSEPWAERRANDSDRWKVQALDQLFSQPRRSSSGDDHRLVTLDMAAHRQKPGLPPTDGPITSMNPIREDTKGGSELILGLPCACDPKGY